MVVTDVWASMGQEAEQKKREQAFAGYQVNGDVMSRANTDALYLHCLPAHRGEEISAELMDAADTVIWEEAEKPPARPKSAAGNPATEQRLKQATPGPMEPGASNNQDLYQPWFL